MAKSQKRYLVLLVFGLLVIIAAGVWMVFGRKTQIYEKTEEIFGNPFGDYRSHPHRSRASSDLRSRTAA